jgi:solute carrier family 25 carnitine/acylcarnitine transporter 20/29
MVQEQWPCLQWFRKQVVCTASCCLCFAAHNIAPAAALSLQVMGAGVMAGFGLWGSMFPIDTIKSKIQADSLSKPQFKGTLNCLERSVAVEVTETAAWLSALHDVDRV